MAALNGREPQNLEEQALTLVAIAAAGLMQDFISQVAYRKKNNITF